MRKTRWRQRRNVSRFRPTLVSTPTMPLASAISASAPAPMRRSAQCRRAASAKLSVVRTGSAYPDSGSQAAAPMPNSARRGSTSRISSGDSIWALMPRSRCMAMFAATVSTSSGPSKARNPVCRKPASPPTTSSKFSNTCRVHARPCAPASHACNACGRFQL